MDLNITNADSPTGWTIVRVEGEIDLATAPDLEQALEHVLSSGSVAVAVDLDPVTFIDSSGLRALITSQKRLDEVGGSLAVAARQGPARRLLELAGVAEVLNLVDSVDRLSPV